MDLKKWKYFCVIAELGSLAKAAQVLEVAQSALSRQIALLESECGGQLLHRTGRGVVPTRLGESVVPKARALLEQADQLAMEIRQAANVPVGPVRLGLVHSTTRPLVRELFLHLREHAPGVQLHVLEAFTGQLDEYCTTGRIDVAVLNRYRPAEQREETLGSFDMYLVGAGGHPATAAETIEFRKLDGMPLVLPGMPSAMRSRYEQHARKHGIALRQVFEVETVQSMKDIVATGHAFTILPSYAVADDVYAGRLSISRIVKPVLRRFLCLQVTTARPTSLAAREVARAVATISRRLIAEGVWPRSLESREPTPG